MRHYRLFQAWQNQDKAYTDFLTKTIKKVVEMEHEKGIDIEVIRFPAQDEAGSPDVVNMVWEQIANCDLFVGDLTSIADINTHSISNPNVMYEVGIADAILGEKRVILVCSKETNIEKLAFDVNHKRISPLNKKNEKASEFLAEWIEAGIAECDIQQLDRDFVLKDLFDDLYVVYNNFMRMIFHSDYSYEDGVLPPSLEKINTNLRAAVFNELMISVEYDGIISRLRKEIRHLYDTNQKRYISDIIKIYNALDKYNWFIRAIQKSAIFIENDTNYEALLQNSKAFYITDIEEIDEIYGSVIFERKYVYINGNPAFQNVFLREMFSDEVLKKCHCQNVSVPDGKLTGIKTLTYTLESKTVNLFGKYIFDVVTSVYDFMDKMNFAPTNNIPDLTCNTIIAWVKSE